jgi:glycosyltransferase involved in cell wall biosynthesis
MATTDNPPVSVVVCTYNRPEALRRALTSVLRQDHTDFEVIVVDDGSAPPVSLPDALPAHVRVVRTEHGGVGAARAAGLDVARGQLIAYCDDDDEWGAGHLSSLVDYLEKNPDVDLVYADSAWAEDGSEASAAWSTDYDITLLFQVNFIFASDVLHRAAPAREAGGFDRTLMAYEDWDLWLRMSRNCTLRHLRAILGTRHWSEGCISASKCWNDWERVYHNRRHGRFGEYAAPELVRFDPGTWQEGRRELNWHSVLDAWQASAEGYAAVGRHLLQAVRRRGVDVTMALPKNQPVEEFRQHYKPVTHWGRFAFHCDHQLQPARLRCDRVVCLWMWESTQVPSACVEEINRSVTLQYVPCSQNVDSLRDCGVHVPTKVLHLGVDSEAFPTLSRSRSDGFTFGSFGDFSPRKGIDVLIRAFQDEFRNGEPARLVLKSTGPAPAYEIWHPGVTLVMRRLNQHDLLEFLRQMDAFILPSRGEGFGLCGIEAMATGLPLIATNWGGPSEYMNPEYAYPLKYHLVEARGEDPNHSTYTGRWAEPDYEHLRYLMRQLYEHPEEAARMGRLASEHVHRFWTWDRVAEQLCHDLDELAAV